MKTRVTFIDTEDSHEFGFDIENIGTDEITVTMFEMNEDDEENETEFRLDPTDCRLFAYALLSAADAKSD